MSKWFKHVSAGALALTACAAVAATLSVKEVNERVKELLAPFNNETTEAAVVFRALDIDDVRVLNFGVEGQLAKTGKVNSLKLRLPSVKYAYAGPRGLPAFEGELALDMDLLKSFPQDALNDLGAGAEEIVTDTVREAVEEYGEAATLDAKVDELVKNEAGDIQAMKLHIDMKLDLAKLPEAVPVEEVPLVYLRLEFAVNLQGMMLAARGDLNPKYARFSPDQSGLKEIIEGLLQNDQKTYNELGETVAWLDMLATDMVNRPKEGRFK